VPFDQDEVNQMLAKSRINWVLFEISSTVFDYKQKNSGTDHQDLSDDFHFESDSGSTFGDDSIQDIIEDLSSRVQNLIDLSDGLGFHAGDFGEQSDTSELPLGDARLIKQSPADYYVDMIILRFPSADKCLVRLLGQENWKRFKRCREDREKNGIYNQLADPILKAGTVTGTQFHDSGIGTSAPSEGSLITYGETITSFQQDDGNVVQIPILPTLGKERKPFECLACNKMVKISNKNLWKYAPSLQYFCSIALTHKHRRHLYSDLRPYICIFEDCPAKEHQFSIRDDWVEHIGVAHGLAPEWQSISCPLCGVETGNGRASCSRHIASHLEEIALAALPNTSEIDDVHASTSKDLSRHLVAVHEDRESYECPICNFRSPRIDDCRRHVRLTHQSSAQPIVILTPSEEE
jgi:hypothetical protein